MSFINQHTPKAIKRKETRSKTQLSPTKTSPKVSPSKSSSKVKSSKNYNDLSIVYTSDEIFTEKFNNIGLIKSAKESLIDLQLEAQNCLNSSQKLLNWTSKKLKSSQSNLQNTLVITPNQRDVLESLHQSMNILNTRLYRNESVIQMQIEESKILKTELNSLSNKLEDQNFCKLESNSMKAGCTAQCYII
jgi:hypothetical protein